jgi:hypothetical protein
MDLELIEKLLAEVGTAKKAMELLQRVYLELGPYRDGKIEDQTWNKVRDFFDFDDSE